MNQLAIHNPKQIDLIRRTVAQDCNSAEFDQFMHICRNVRLDPLRRQIYCFVFNKDKADKRQMTIVTAIGGYRAIADRTGTYRPGPTKIVYRDDLKNPATNPLGIEYAHSTVYKHAHGEWHPVEETAYWDEYAPIKEQWENGQRTGKFALDAKKDGWKRMARVMIEKCAEAKALRRGWPDDFAGLEVEEEIDKRFIDLTASEVAETVATENKLALIGGKDALTVQWDMNGRLERVPLGSFADSALKWASDKERTDTEMRIWWNHNLVARSEYKAKKPSEYLDFQKAWEAKTAEIEHREVTQAAE